MKKLIILFTFAISLCIVSNDAYGYIYKTAWVGESFYCEVKPFGTHYNVQWYSNSSCIKLTGSTNYRKQATITHYFKGTATITCTWEYQLYYGGPLTRRTQTWDIQCQDNPIQLLSDNKINLEVGKSCQLSYKLTYNNNYSSYANPTFYTSNTNIVSVTKDGKVTALSKGKAYVYLHSDVSGNEPQCIVTVTNVEPTSIKIPETLFMRVGEEYKITPEITPANAVTKLKWHSHTYHTTVSDQGVVKAIKLGTGYISVKTENNLSAECTVHVVCDPDSIKIADYDKQIEIFPKDTTDMIAISLYPRDASSNLTLRSHNENIATAQIIQTSYNKHTFIIKIYGHNDGETDIECKTDNGLCQTIKVKVKKYTMKNPEDGKKINYYLESSQFNERSKVINSYLK